jgi:HPt (histidine-containing phosphotransfer) domain-containing protein
MLIYNYKKEFLGIDEVDLKSLGFSNLSELQAESDDFADLFVKEPGHIHNFKHIHWIDFASSSDSVENSKVIIKTSSKSFKCSLEVKSAYLSDNPSEKAFLVYLQNLRELTISENGQVIETLLTTPSKIQEELSEPISTPEFTYENNFEEEPSESNTIEDITPEIETIEQDEKQEDEIIKDIDEPYEEPALELDIVEPMNIELEEEENQPEEVEEIEEVYEEVQSGYVYDPNVASSELGLPVDLIEEFIQDFIDQAKEFKEKLYSAFESGDTSTVKSLSHKLKGVAANLRIEDALEALTIINTSDNQTEVKSNLDTFYIIISKLAGEKVKVAKKVKKRVPPPKSKQEDIKENIKPETDNSDDALIVDFKDESENKPEKIEPEVVDTDSEDDLILSFKDDDETPIQDIPKKLEDENNTEDDLIIDFKDDTDYKEEVELPETTEIDDDDLILDFKDETTADETVSQNDAETERPLDIEEPNITYNKASAAKEIGLDNESFKELFDDYIAEALAISSKINNAIQSGNDAVWKSNAVQLKGMSDNMRVEDLTAELETLINTKDTEVAKAANEKIHILISKLSNVEN